MIKNDNIEDAVHQLRGLLQVLNSFVDCLEQQLKNDDAATSVAEIKEYCSIVLGSLHEAEELIEKVKNS